MEENTSLSEQPTEVSSAEPVESKKDTVAYDTYRKVLNEKKKTAATNAELAAELEVLRQEKMTAEGDKDGLIQSLRNQLSDSETKLKETNQTFAYRSVSEQVKREALKSGCKDTEVFVDLLKESDWDSLEVGKDFSVNPDDLKRLIDSSKQRFSHVGLFSEANPNVNDVIPSKVEKDTTNPIAKMSIKEKALLIAKME